MSQIQEDQLSELNLHVDGEVKQHLGTAAKWTKFIAVTVFIFCGIFLFAGIAASAALATMFKKISPGSLSFLTEYSAGLIIGILIFVIAIMGSIYYLLYNFAVKIKTALLNDDQDSFDIALRSLKTYFVITTIFSLLVLLINIFNLFK